MSEMSYLEKLLDGVEVEWKTLGEVAKYVRGLIYSKSSESADGQGYKVLRANNITLSNNCLNLNDVKVVRFDTKVKSSQKLYKNDILISAASGSREHVGKVAYIESDIDYYFGGFMGVVRCDEKLNPRYLFHVLTSDIFQKYLDEMLNSSTINNLNSAVMGRFKIPLPCPDNPEKSLAIQSEIVRILDKFTALTAELTAELSMRKKQYNYYRDQLLSFKEGEVEWKALGEIGEVRMCKRILKSQTSSEGEIPFYKIGTFGKEPDSYISCLLYTSDAADDWPLLCRSR
uniref:restriction endonuclease subunit S n=1 Tax=Escherichia coli TaxID=562 RepID=UPI000BB95E07